MKRLFFLLVAAALFACSDDERPKKAVDPNANRNNTELMPQFGQLEFPKAKGGHDNLITAYATNDYGLTYAMEWDKTKHAPRWVCFNMTAETLARTYEDELYAGKYKWNYAPDVDNSEQIAPSGELNESFFPGTEDPYVAAQLCAPTDRLYDKDAITETFYMTNVMPQAEKFHEGMWKRLENNVLTWAGSVDTLFVCRGGTIDKADQILGYTKSKFIVPRYYFMALLGKSGSNYKAAGFWLEHVNENTSSNLLSNYLVNIDELEDLTGIDFFCNLPDTTEEALESASSESIRKAWGL